RVAIVGMACRFPGAPDLDTFRRNLEAGVDAIADVPPQRWDPAEFYDPASRAVDRFYCKRGGFLGAAAPFDALAHGVMPVAAREACASALVAVDQACRDLVTGRVDVALAGGVHLGHDPSLWSVFCQLGALSRAQEIRPFDRRADGILIGEGVGVVVLKRADEA